uniref:Uncharacterized LOC111857162 n=1 Tax=Paramormyrops kingsleyae TaxID=1676925 RepID=A0A3B3SZP2_9TELE|nr:uncharacterized protein LOC111857162 [Paramormyrops kingsleyae]
MPPLPTSRQDLNGRVTDAELTHWLLSVGNSSKPDPHTFSWRSGGINRSSEEVGFTPLRGPCTSVKAPTVPAAMTSSKEHLAVADKLRKHIVESCAEIPSAAAWSSFSQQPDSRQEKPDVLEMMVRFLIWHLQQRSVRRSSFTVAVSEGYSSCIQEVKNLLSQDERQTEGQKNLLSHLQSAGFILRRAESDSPKSDGLSTLQLSM